MKKTAAACVLLALALALSAHAQQKHESAIFVVDVSSTIVDDRALPRAAKVVWEMNAKFPDYVRSAGLLTFGDMKSPQLRWVFPVGPYQREAVARAAGSLQPGNGPTPLAAAVAEAGQGLIKAKGNTAVIIVSDGKNNGPADPVARVGELKRKEGDRVCVFTIQIGDDKRGEELLKKMADASGCGKFTRAADLRSGRDVQALVDFIFPPESKPVADADHDGVLDPDDQCPDTPLNAQVDHRGCWVLKNVNFDSGSAEIKPEYHAELDAAVQVLFDNPELQVVIEGHTDSQGSGESNQQLSEERANAVRNFFIGRGIHESRLTALGLGESQPIADNETPEGRAQNRRIELRVEK